MVRDVKPAIYGLPGLPKWLDLPFIKRIAEKYGITKEEAREHLRLNTLCEISMANGENHGTKNESRTEACIRVNRQTLSQEPRDAPEVRPENGG